MIYFILKTAPIGHTALNRRCFNVVCLLSYFCIQFLLAIKSGLLVNVCCSVALLLFFVEYMLICYVFFMYVSGLCI